MRSKNREKNDPAKCPQIGSDLTSGLSVDEPRDALRTARLIGYQRNSRSRQPERGWLVFSPLLLSFLPLNRISPLDLDPGNVSPAKNRLLSFSSIPDSLSQGLRARSTRSQNVDNPTSGTFLQPLRSVS